MAKGTGPKGAGNPGAKGTKVAKGIPNKHIHARIAYLNQVATYLALQQSPKTAENTSKIANEGVSEAVTVANTNTKSGTDQSSHAGVSLANRGLPYLFTTHLRAVSRKSQISLSQDMKRSLCKVCNGPLVPGQTSAVHMENSSKGGKKPWANVQVIRCLNCDSDKRFPLGALRQTHKSERKSQHGAATRPMT